MDGRPCRIHAIMDESGAVAAVELTWEREPGQWVTIIGHGRRANAEAVVQLARQVVQQPQRIGFKVTLGLVPDGWELSWFKDSVSISLISYRDPVKANLSLDVQWTPKPNRGRNADVEGFQTAHNVTVNKRPAQLVQAAQFWRLTATLPDGSGFLLKTPRSFSADQVIAVARSIRLNRP